MNKKHDTDDNELLEGRDLSESAPLPVKPENIFHFPDGLPAFEDARQFVFIHKPETSPFIFMQALEPATVSFVCLDPFLIYPEYRPKISQADMKSIGITEQDNILLLSIVTAATDPENMTANLKGPMVLNLEKCIGKQIICDGQDYPVRYKLWEALNSIDEEAALKTVSQLQ